MTELYRKARTVLTAAPTALVAIGTVATIILQEVDDAVGAPAWLVTAVGAVVTTSAVAATIVRRVTPVLPEERGL